MMLRNSFSKYILSLALLLAAAATTKAQNYYVFQNATYGYIVNNGGTPGVSTTFTPSALWIASGALGTTNRTIQSYTDGTDYMRGGNGSFTLGNSQNNWQLRNSVLTYRANLTNYYVAYESGSLTCDRYGTNTFTPYAVSLSTVAATLTSGSISGDETLTTTGSYTYTSTATYTSATTNYRFNNADHYYPSQTTSAFEGTRTWSLSGGSGYATVDAATGIITVSSLPTDGDVTLTLSCTMEEDGLTTSATKTITLKAACAAPTFSFDSGTNQVTIASGTSGATIYYTTNGTTPTTSSTQYTGSFEQSTAGVVRAIAVKDGLANSAVSTFEVVKLDPPYASVASNGTSVTFSHPEDGVTFYYTYGNYDSGGEFADPTTSSTSWHTGDAAVTIATENVVKVIAAKAATATKGYITSDVYSRRVNATDMTERQMVIMYNDGTAVHFLANVNGSIQDVTTFSPATCIWEALPFAYPTTIDKAETLVGSSMKYEPFIRFRNNGRYLQVHEDANDFTQYGWDNWLRTTTNPSLAEYYYYPRYQDSSRGTIISAVALDLTEQVQPGANSFMVGFNGGTWKRYTAKNLAIYPNDFFTVYYPVEQLGGADYLLNVDYPANYDTMKEEVNKGESVTITSSITGSDGTGTGTYGLPYYRVGNEASGYYYYYYADSSSPMSTEPTPSTDIRISYELLNGQSYLDVDEGTHTYTLTRDPGRDLYVTVRVTATPYIDGVAQPDGVQTKDYQFHILTSPPFPAPVISRVEGTNNYQMTCSAANAIIEYQINDDGSSATCTECGDTPSPYHDGWCLYDGPITVTTAGTVISARSFRQSDNQLSDPVDYFVGGARLLPPVITIADNGTVTITANPANAAIDGYTGSETFYYTVDGSEPDATSAQFAGTFTVSNGQTVKAIATATGFTSSAIALSKYQVASGTSTYGVVTINDYEDHDWSYYQPSSELPTGYPDELHSPYPRNVQITYFGYGENTLSTSATAAPAANTFTTSTYAGDVKVGIGEEGHTFVYYKTLERDANNRFPYELIPNPFSVRPDVRTYSGSKTVTFTLSDTGGDGWGASHLQVDFSNGRSTENITFTESQASKTVTLSVNTGVTMTLTWVAGGGKSDECSFTVSYDGNTVFSSGLNPQDGPIGAVKVNGSEAVTTYTGFYRWRIKSITDGAVYSASTGGTQYNEGDMLEAETTYYFQPTDNSETNAHNATSMMIELEALWAPASVNSNTNYGSVERNFYVGRSGTNNNVFYRNTPCTYSSFYPNGTTNGTTLATLANRLTIGTGSASADSKVEYYIVSGNNATMNAAGHNVTIGRGVEASGTYVAQNFYGLSANNTTSFRLRIESGSYANLYFMGTNGQTSGVLSSVLGSDYDRAKKDNSKLRVTNDILVSNQGYIGAAGNVGADAFVGTVKSGDFFLTSDVPGGGYQFYLSSPQANRTYGKRTLTIEGGRFSDIAGGLDQAASTTMANLDRLMVDIRIKGGQMDGAVYGAAQYSNAAGNRRMVITGGNFTGWIAGGANGTQTEGGRMAGASYIYVGGNANVDSNNSSTLMNRAVGGNVFGAGCGYGPTSNSGQVTVSTNVVLADNAYVERGVYGGGSYGYTTATSNVYILGGKVDGKQGGVNGTSYSAAIEGGVFGGACQNQGGTVNIYMTGGQVNGGVYGGSNSSGNINNNVTMHIDGGQVGEDAENPANIHGGGLGNSTRVLGSVNLTLGTGDVAVDTVRHVTVYGDVYGGSAQGRTNGNTSRTAGAVTNVTMNAGKIYGSLYGGGLGNATYAADVYGPVQVTVNGGGIHATINDGSGAVYGCNNANGAPQSTVNVDIYGTDAPADGRSYALDGVYGGGNASAYDGTPVVRIHNCENSIEEVYGGGNAAAVGGTDVTIFGADSIGTVYGGGHGDRYATPELIAPVNGDVVVRIYGGKIGKVYGASNSRGPVSGSINVYVDKQAEGSGTACALKVGELYSGGNLAASAAGTLHIGCTGTYVAPSNGNRIGYELEGIGEVYGGANSANITGDITLNINGGIISRIFGGNNNSGDINGRIVVNINNTEESCDWYVGDVLGGGNQAVYTAPAGDKNYPQLNLTRGTISGNVNGGGYGDAADATKGVVNGNPDINLTGCNLLGDLFGGGQMADVNGSVAIDVTGGSVAGAIYGGGALADTNIGNTVSTSGQTTAINLVSGTVHDVYGGGLGDSSTAALVGGDISILLNGSTESGAANDCQVTGRIFGCNNVNGTPKGHVLVHVYKTAGGSRTASDKLDSPTVSDHVFQVAAVYGGGNMAAYQPASGTDFTEVIIDGCDDTSIGYVYGGGNAASVPATSVTINGAYEINYVFGGGNGKDALPNGDPNPGANVGYLADGTTAYGTGMASVNAYGGLIHNVFGGSNTLGNVRQSSVAYLDENSACPLRVDEVYGGGNEAYMAGNSSIKLGCITYLKEIYGGARSADLGGDIVLTITSGHFDRVFGGNNLSGTINGSITVNVEETGCHPVTIGEIYGCGNRAAYTTAAGKSHPTVNIKSFTSIGRVFGGGLGEGAIVTGNPTVNVNEVIGENATATSDYAGTTRTLSDGSTVALPAHDSGKIGSIGTVFGGGNAAKVVGNTTVNVGTVETVDYVSMVDGESTLRTGITVEGASITGNVYGGGNQAEVTGNTNVTIGKEK